MREQLEEVCDFSPVCAPARARRHREAIGQLCSDNKQLQSDKEQLQSDKEQLQAEVLAMRMQLARSQAQVQQL